MNVDAAPMFSVVIPAYNVEEYIEMTLESVYKQTIQDFEIIVVNDGSRDNTQNILEKQIDSRLRVILQENQGETRARNRGIQEAQGKYIAFLDADDIWLPYHLELARDFFERYPHYSWYSSVPLGVTVVTNELLELPRPSSELTVTICSYFDDVSILPSSTVMLRTSITTENLFEPDMKSGGDQIGWIRFCLESSPSLGLRKSPTVIYRKQRPGAATALGAAYNEKFVHVCLNNLEAVCRIVKFYNMPKIAINYLRLYSNRQIARCIRYSMLQNWFTVVRESYGCIGGLASFFILLFIIFHQSITTAIYFPFYFISKIRIKRI